MTADCVTKSPFLKPVRAPFGGWIGSRNRPLKWRAAISLHRASPAVGSRDPVGSPEGRQDADEHLGFDGFDQVGVEEEAGGFMGGVAGEGDDPDGRLAAKVAGDTVGVDAR